MQAVLHDVVVLSIVIVLLLAAMCASFTGVFKWRVESAVRDFSLVSLSGSCILGKDTRWLFYSQAVDAWAVGVLSYELWTGRWGTACFITLGYCVFHYTGVLRVSLHWGTACFITLGYGVFHYTS
jgi:hypothetical protein